MSRFKLTIEYDGSGFVGWQRQENGFGVQQALEEAVTAFSGETPRVFGAGRTDSGVHALGQVGHFDLQGDFSTDTVRDALNYHMRNVPAVVLEAALVDDEFHSRFSATGRSYIYKIVNRRAPLSIDKGHCWWIPVPLDAEAMHEAAKVLIGKHDFTSFRATNCQADSPLRTLNTLRVERQDEMILIHAQARSFLHHQVRNFTGSLKRVGTGKWTATDLKAALEARDRRVAGETAPADGLYLTAVSY
ncbi:MAG: tRNA pseudouridine(38-40) synthase TruA [Rhodospirillaceae bacterium]|jgi:tRNA pseudouridine38-40 synthase|nr:tRNA pseudouridine(38-40) synthase TruA [Rhodospirillaceae bacterium]MBT5244905.1 tRNA pseudouridine(38-40) synthase TruA [Rhodospirillaceae bacterium]MBT5562705.1 tRNA pseudouridine(38-40) synthase TruA [Rhodospirillaceae bacterium]MBT6242986.1 tRNA pseudouridine(38-40) synthase TruA [Rhodospirillaceae bacterium]MBT7136833.1 tRNA pseudouridine(38-40) synthase TruA [Rhodospirillaceae bacterium]